MGVTDLIHTFARLEPLIFRIDIPVGAESYGTGFFISREFALTAFHNLYPSVLDDPAVPLSARFQGKDIDLVWALSGDEDRKWQERYDVAVLRAVTPLDSAPKEKFFYLDEAWEGRDRDLKWMNRKVTAVGIPCNIDGPKPIPGMTSTVRPLVDAPRIVGSKIEGLIPAALYFTSDPNDVNAAYGMSGSPVYDEELRGIVGVVVAVKKGFYATEFSHLVKNWRDGRKYFVNFLPRRSFVAEYSATATVRRLFASAVLVAAAFGLFWFKSGPAVPKELEVGLLRNGSSHAETVKDRIVAARGEKFRLLITSPTAGYLYVVDREVAVDGKLGTPSLVFPTLTSGASRNKVTPGAVVSWPDPSDRAPTIETSPSPQLPDSEYAGEALTVLVYASPVSIDHLEAGPIELTPEQFPDDGGRLLIVSPAAPAAVKKISVVVQR